MMNELLKIADDLKLKEELNNIGEEIKKNVEVFNHAFKGLGTHPSECRVHIYTINEIKLVVFEDLAKGTSVTNASEQIANEVMRLKNLDPAKTIFTECYPYYGGDNWDLDQIQFQYDSQKNEFHSPHWNPIHHKEFIQAFKALISNNFNHA